MKQKPGVMIYFDMREVLESLNDRERGQLFTAILEYAQDGTVQKLPEKLTVAWAMIRMRIDSDSDRYDRVVVQRKYANYVRWAKRHEMEPMTYDEWLEKHGFGMTEREEETFSLIHSFAKTAYASESIRNLPYTNNNNK